MMVLTKEQIDDMRTSLRLGAQPFTKDAIDSLCAMAQGTLVPTEADAQSPKTPEGHKARHVELHKALDELFSDFINHHPEQTAFTSMPLIDLLRWSNEQQHNPTEQTSVNKQQDK